ncbi:MAG: peptidylprolyl isomerase [Ruminococcaceae bacterium]|nr:peptidylprolyl isomerase [Oscillospiraceae bacterium]
MSTGCKNKVYHPVATIEVEGFGTIVVELYDDVAPNTVANFVTLAQSGYYNGLIFHRVIEGFMIQGGCPEGSGFGGPGYSIEGEFSSNGHKNDLKHTPGVISMARSGHPDSAGSQFFICTSTPYWLDGDYAAFGKVIEGLDVVMAISHVDTNSKDKPFEDVVIKSITIDTKGGDFSDVEKIK